MHRNGTMNLFSGDVLSTLKEDFSTLVGYHKKIGNEQ